VEPLEPSDVLAYINERLELDERLSDLWVVAEIATYSRSQQGHRYFTLKDAYSSLRAVLFRTEMPELELEAGAQVIVHGRMGVYRQRGELQFVCDFVRPAGVGIDRARFDELKERLEKDGLFDASRKRALPRFPQKIGLVTSPTGAAIQDIRRVVGRRWPLAELALSPTVVQGEQAAPRIVSALHDLANEPGLDVAILARGGGSAEDLWAFNDERLARAVYRFPVPLVTGIGHATDTTIVDYVADKFAPTPSAAAEACTPDRYELAQALRGWQLRGLNVQRTQLASLAASVRQAARHLRGGAPRPQAIESDVARYRSLFRSVALAAHERSVAQVEAASRRLTVLDPMATLGRGFAIVQDAGTRKVVATTKAAKPGKRLSVSVKDGAFWAEVS
jgi:exodeoxyribonuclease VII large subunit